MLNKIFKKIWLISSLMSLCMIFVYNCGDSVNPLGGDTGIEDATLRYCKNNAQCLIDEECKNNVCVKKSTTVCRNKNDCNLNQDCINGKCVDMVDDAGIDGGDDIKDVDIVKKGKITAEPMTVEFGSMRFGERLEKTVKIRNSGDGDLKVLKVELDVSADPDTFGFKTDFTFGTYLKPGEEFEILVACQQNDEKPDSGDLLISSDDADLPIFRIKMKNSYKDEPDIMVNYINSEGKEISYPDENSNTNEMTIDIGNIPIGEKKKQVITLINVAEEGILKISEIKYDIYNNNDTNVNKFTAALLNAPEGEEVVLPVYLSPSDLISLVIEYPADKEAMEDKYSVSIKTGDLDINNDGDSKEDGLLIISLKTMAGYRDPEIAVLDLDDKDVLSTGLDFGEVEKGSNSKKLFKICNIGGGELKIDKASGLVNGNFALNPSSLEASLTFNQCINNIEIQFSPTQVGEVKDILRILSNDPVKSTAELDIRGVGINSEMRVNPTAIDFGDILLNSDATPVSIEVKNIGDGTLFIYNIQFGAGSSKDFSLLNLPQSFPIGLKADETILFDVGFKPTTLGAKSGAVMITSSDTENLSVEVTLLGNGSNCDSDHADCNNDASDGCEVDLRIDTNNCGACGYLCDLSNANSICDNKKCKIESCKGSYQDCNNDAIDGCESDKLLDNLNCGSCFNKCGSSSSCQNGICVCDSGYLNCDNDFATNGCEVDKNNDFQNCGSCSNNCGDNSVCISGVCGCQTDYKNCDSDLTNGCEANIRINPNHCGDCNVRCGLSAFCDNGQCSCNSGYGNCNGDWFDGCEKYLMYDKNNCGLCGKVCQNLPNATVSCEMGSCKFTCDIGYKDCDGSVDNGCESYSNTDPSNCGGCGIKCGNNMDCINGTCQCKQNYADCNNNIQDGCEINLTNDSNNCGSCGNSCGQYAYCNSGSCNCNSGYGNCNNNWADGCEVNLSSDATHCGDCNTNCTTLQNVASVSCVNYSCVINSCSVATANCDANVSNGCEVNHSSSANVCGSSVYVGELCGDDGNPSLQSQSGYGSKWFKVRVKECDSGITSDRLAVEITLDVPAGVDYNLIIYTACGTNPLWESSGGSGVTEGVRIYLDDTQCWPGSCDDTFDLWIEVRYISGGNDVCSQWILNVYSQDGWY